MTVIRPNGISGVTSITSSGDAINFYRSDGTLGPELGINVNVTSGVSTFAALNVTGVLTYEDVTSVDSVGIITARSDLSIADKIIHTGDTNTAIRFPAADTITAETGGTERLRIDSSGRMGLGTSSPAQPLDIVTSGADAYIRQSNGTVTGFVGVNNNNSTFDIYTFSNHPTRFFTNNQERMRIDSSGRLLVGTSTDTTARFVVKGSAGSGDDGINVISGSTTVGSKAAIFFTPSTTGSFSTGSAIKAERLSPDGSDLQFYTCTVLGNSPTERMRIDSSGNVKFEYTDSSTSTSAQVPPGLRIYNKDNTLNRLAGIHFSHGGAGTANAGIFHVTTNTATGSTTCLGDLAFYMKASGSSTMVERMRIDSSGRLIVGNTDASGSSLRVDAASGTDGPLFDSGGTGNTNHALLVRDSANNQLLRVNNDGNMGLGTASPQAITGYTVLTLNNSSQGGAIEFKNNNTSYGRLLQGSSAVILETKQNIPLIFGTGTSSDERMRITSSGNVGINQSSPSRALEVRDASSNVNSIIRIATQATSSTTNGYAQLEFKHGTENGAFIWQNAGATAGYAGANGMSFYLGHAADFAFYCNGNNEKVRIRNGGGITFNGDTAAANALDDYEEGTWIPTVSDSGGTATWSFNYAHTNYTKVGRLVTLSATLSSISYTGTPSGYLRIGSLPFTKADGRFSSGSVRVLYINFGADSYITCEFIGSIPINILYFRVSTNNAVGQDLPASSLSNGNAAIVFSITYEVA